MTGMAFLCAFRVLVGHVIGIYWDNCVIIQGVCYPIASIHLSYYASNATFCSCKVALDA